MKRDWLKRQLGDAATDEVVDAIMAQNGVDVGKATDSANSFKAKLEEANARIGELEGAANAKLTDEERWKKQLDDANEAAAKASRELNEMCAIAEFGRAGLTEEDYAPFLAAVVSDSREGTVEAAKAISSVVMAKAQAATDAAKKAALGSMGTPAGGEPAGPVETAKAFDALSLEQQRQWVKDNPGGLSKLK